MNLNAKQSTYQGIQLAGSSWCGRWILTSESDVTEIIDFNFDPASMVTAAIAVQLANVGVTNAMTLVGQPLCDIQGVIVSNELSVGLQVFPCSNPIPIDCAVTASIIIEVEQPPVSTIESTSPDNNETHNLTLGQYKSDGTTSSDCDACLGTLEWKHVDASGTETLLSTLEFNKGSNTWTETLNNPSGAAFTEWNNTGSILPYLTTPTGGTCGPISNDTQFNFDFRQFSFDFCFINNNSCNLKICHEFCENVMASNVSITEITGNCIQDIKRVNGGIAGYNDGEVVFSAEQSRVLKRENGRWSIISGSGLNAPTTAAWITDPLDPTKNINTAYYMANVVIDRFAIINGYPPIYTAGRGSLQISPFQTLQRNTNDDCNDEWENWDWILNGVNAETTISDAAGGNQQGRTAEMHSDRANPVNGRSIVYTGISNGNAAATFDINAFFYTGVADQWDKNIWGIPKATIPIISGGVVTTTGVANSSFITGIHKVNNPAATSGDIRHNDIVGVFSNNYGSIIHGSYQGGAHELQSSYTWSMKAVTGAVGNSSLIRNIDGIPMVGTSVLASGWIDRLDANGNPIFLSKATTNNFTSVYQFNTATSNWEAKNLYANIHNSGGIGGGEPITDEIFYYNPNDANQSVQSAYNYSDVDNGGKASYLGTFECDVRGTLGVGAGMPTSGDINWGLNENCNNCIPES